MTENKDEHVRLPLHVIDKLSLNCIIIDNLMFWMCGKRSYFVSEIFVL